LRLAARYESGAPTANPAERQRVHSALGELLFAAVDAARRASADQRQIRGRKRAAILGERLNENAMVLVRPRIGGIQQIPSRTYA